MVNKLIEKYKGKLQFYKNMDNETKDKDITGFAKFNIAKFGEILSDLEELKEKIIKFADDYDEYGSITIFVKEIIGE